MLLPFPQDASLGCTGHFQSKTLVWDSHAIGALGLYKSIAALWLLMSVIWYRSAGPVSRGGGCEPELRADFSIHPTTNPGSQGQ